MAMLKSLVASLLWYGKVETTEARAKEARCIAERMITLAKTDSLHARRLARRLLNDETLVRRLFTEVGPQYVDRPGGYSRLIRLGQRRGDAACRVRLELVELT
jgi:large subunit ribosomal protein L17